MARSVILACEMLEDEVHLALRAVPADERPPLVWMQSGLHDRPERLREVLQHLIDELDAAAETGIPATLPSVRPGRGPAAERSEQVQVGPVEEVVLAMGFCGGALRGLSAKHLSVVVPRADDCISLLLNRGCRREDIQRDPRSYYVTRGWFGHESTLKESFEDWQERFGAERAARLRRSMFAGYERVDLIDTDAYDVQECVQESTALADSLELEHSVVPGSVQLLERLFKGGGEIVIVPPGEPVELVHLFGAKVGQEAGQKGD
jgi:hypothetical protein